jgi:hypothetical protein
MSRCIRKFFIDFFLKIQNDFPMAQADAPRLKVDFKKVLSPHIKRC